VVQMLRKNWWLLALCGVFDAIVSVIYFSHAGSGFHRQSSARLLGEFTLAGGVCMIAASAWNFTKGKSWLLALRGLACSALGAIFAFWKGPLRFQTIALLVVVMAVSIAVYEFSTARVLWPHYFASAQAPGHALRGFLKSEWLPIAAGVIGVGFALAFLGFVFHWIRLEPASPGQTLRWLGSFFGFCAICMLALPWMQQAFPTGPRQRAL
jgi:hypothetical protein